MEEIGVVVMDAKGAVIAASEGAFHLLSLAPGDTVGLKSILSQIPQDTSWKVGEKTLELTMLSFEKEGSWKVLVFWEKRFEELQRYLKEKRLFLAGVNALPEHVYVKDRNHRFTFANAAFAHHHGFTSPDEVLGKTDFDLYPEEVARYLWEKEEELLHNGTPMLHDEREVLDSSAGVPRKIWMVTNKVPLRDEKGDIVGLVGISRDITEQKRIEEALRASEKEKVLILNALEDRVVYYEKGPRIVWVNQAVLRSLHLEPKEVIGKYCFEVFEKRNTPCPGCATVRAFVTGKTEEAEVTSHDGTIWHQRAYPILDEEGQVFRVVTISSNVTAKKQAEERILYLTFHDPLTGLYNRLFFEDALKRLDVPRQLPLSVVMVDVNGLKLVNDVFGHSQGDALLKKVSAILTRACRKEDIVCRFGGDEFVILLPKTPFAAAQDILQRIQKLCDEESKKRETPFPVSMALGCATKEKEHEDIDTILSEAENRMYQSKTAKTKSSRTAFLLFLEQYLRETPGEMETHHERMRILAQKMGEALGLSKAETDNLVLLAQFHDLGKVAIPQAILVKTESLTEKEWAEIRKHPEVGYRIARLFPELLPIAEGVLAHHEHFDGTGYPQGLKGKDIPLFARIIAIIDAFVAMTSNRPYQKAMSFSKALEEITKGAGTQFDPELVQVFLQVVKEQALSLGHDTLNEVSKIF
ncbi:MAG: HD domain-containing phosphohydrolase [Atribacterota bacterium]